MNKLNASKMIKGYAELKLGMDKKDVLELLGEPTGTRLRDEIETLTWKHSEWKGLFRGGNVTRTITVDFERGKLTGYDSENMDRSRF